MLAKILLRIWGFNSTRDIDHLCLGVQKCYSERETSKNAESGASVKASWR